MEQQPETQASSAASAGAATSNAVIALDQGLGGILGIKAGMTQVYDDNGDLQAVTVIDLNPKTVVTQVKTNATNGYNAIQVGFVNRKSKSTTKPEQGHAKKAGAEGFYHYQEFRLPESAKLDSFSVGQSLSPEFLKAGDLVDVTATSKGKGFQGGMKRFHMAGGFKSHGASVNHRSLGSIGNRADPAKCFKNKKMPGQMGNYRVTTQNIRVVRVDLENQLILVHGSVPGSRSGIVQIRRAVKAAK